MCGGVAAALLYEFLLYPKFDDFPERIKVLVSGPEGDYDVNGAGDTPAVEMSSKWRVGSPTPPLPPLYRWPRPDDPMLAYLLVKLSLQLKIDFNESIFWDIDE